jgi:hypothetical protein
VAEHEGLTLREANLEQADASYYRIPLGVHNLNAPVEWNDLVTGRGTISVFLRSEVLESDEYTLYVFSHEVFELRELEAEFQRRGGAMTYRELAYLIEPALGGAIHQSAVRHGDELVQRLREERGLET